jgi:O-antigen/teichoic acid export membrane protein
MPSYDDTAGAASWRARRARLVAYTRQRFSSGLLHNATWMLSGQGLELAIRVGYFVIVAHVLGPAGYGTFVACTALVAVMSPFASWGTGQVLIKYVARDRTVLPPYLGNALLVTLVSGSLLALLALLVRSSVLPASATAQMLTAVAIADLLAAQVTSVCLYTFAALEQFRRYAQLLGLSTGMRLIAALVLAGSTANPLHWAYLYAISTAIAAVGGLVAVTRCCAFPRFHLKLLLPSVREGFHFSTSLASESIYNNIDKTMLARLSSVEAAAIYAVAYRFVDAAMLPVRSLAAAAYPEFFRQGVEGVTSTFKFAKRLLQRSVIYGIGTSIVLFLAAGLVPLIMGQAYAESTTALRWLCVLPAIKSVHAFLTDTLTGANYQWQRSSADIVTAVFNVLINLWLIRAYAWRGAAWSSLITDSLLMVLLYMIIRWHLKREHAGREAAIARPILAAGRQ